jgi:hypothetical protein
MRLKPKRHVHVKLPADRPNVRAYLDDAARRRKQAPRFAGGSKPPAGGRFVVEKDARSQSR